MTTMGETLIAEALWGVAAAITEHGKPNETVVNASDRFRPIEIAETDLEPYLNQLHQHVEDALIAESEPSDEEDVVNKPSHYTQEDGLECIDVSYDLTGPWFSIVRYVWRCMDKGNPIQDLEKALRYLEIAEEKGLEKPVNRGREIVFRDLWLGENDDDINETRLYILRAIFGQHDAAVVRENIKILIDLIKEDSE